TIECVDAKSLPACKRRLGARQRRWLDAAGFKPLPGRIALLPDAEGQLARVIAGVRRDDPLWSLAALPWQLPAGRYRLADQGLTLDATLAALGWALGSYRCTRYRKAGRDPAQLLVDKATQAAVAPLDEAAARVRNLVNTPTNDMGPEQLAAAIKTLGKEHKARVREWVGEALLKNNFPTIHMVGRASQTAGAPDAAGAHGGNRRRRQRDAPGRGGAHARRPHRGGGQHRRRRPPDPVRRAGLRGREEARPDHGFRHPDRRGARRPGP